ncbi:hypothetical protein ACLQ29_34425 [Micromonospora sp. DT228]|uniref:hypothetical protein n=1 Tax=Micromonospora sp. DT228 TaxID=3393443 RepID=UPI003CF1D915
MLPIRGASLDATRSNKILNGLNTQVRAVETPAVDDIRRRTGQRAQRGTPEHAQVHNDAQRLISEILHPAVNLAINFSDARLSEPSQDCDN